MTEDPESSRRLPRAFRHYGIANHVADHRVHVAADGEVYLRVWLPYGSDEEIAARLARPTISRNAKSYPPPKASGTVTSRGSTSPSSGSGSGSTTSKREMAEITKRLTRPTFSARMRSGSEEPEPVIKATPMTSSASKTNNSTATHKAVEKPSPKKSQPMVEHKELKTILKTPQNDRTCESKVEGKPTSVIRQDKGGKNARPHDKPPQADSKSESKKTKSEPNDGGIKVTKPHQNCEAGSRQTNSKGKDKNVKYEKKRDENVKQSKKSVQFKGEDSGTNLDFLKLLNSQ